MSDITLTAALGKLVRASQRTMDQSDKLPGRRTAEAQARYDDLNSATKFARKEIGK